MVMMGQIADAERGAMAKVEDRVIPGPAGDIPLRVYDNRPDRPAGPIMLFFHGGGFVIGDLDTHDAYCAEAARALDMPVISVDYRLAPEHPFPAAPEDCEAATRWAADNMPCTGLILSGDSAGGSLAVAVALTLRDAPASKPVIAQYAIYPAVTSRSDWQSARDFADGYLLTQDSMDYFGDHYRWVAGDRRCDMLDYDLTGMPPAVVATAGLDPLRDQGRAYAAKLAESGVPVIYREAQGNIHGYICLRKAIASSNADIAAGFAALKTLLADTGRAG
jgi:acetyl esterase